MEFESMGLRCSIARCALMLGAHVVDHKGRCPMTIEFALVAT